MRTESKAGSSNVEANAEIPLKLNDQATYGTYDEPGFYGFEDEESLYANVSDPMTYNLRWLRTWWAFWALKGTVWDSVGLWKTMGQLFLLSIIVGVLAYNLLPDPNLIDVSKFSGVSAVFSVFVSLMLSFYLSSSVSRWINCVSGFLNLFNAIRNLSMQLHALGVPDDNIKLCLRYSVLSAKFMLHDLHTSSLSVRKREEVTDMMWTHLLRSTSTYSSVEPKEKDVLVRIDDKSTQMWVWVASLLSRMAMDGDIPGMSAATFGRIMDLCQSAQEGLRQVKTSVVVQMPFVYVHTLAVLVQINCVLLSTCLGLALGVTYHGIRNYVSHYYYEVEVPPGVVVEPLSSLIQSLVVELLKGTFGPLLYQAFLEISIMIASPFSGSESAIPVNRLIHQLEKDLSDAFIMAQNPVKWKKPCYSAPPM
mmetsp:Transcript_87745/g.246551  ORF Transcript_87745/g.246551 Transcript_87745/m.246551 type:complete len:421 (+) Transcript_87745:136-1398(+)